MHHHGDATLQQDTGGVATYVVLFLYLFLGDMHFYFFKSGLRCFDLPHETSFALSEESHASNRGIKLKWPG